MHTGEESGDQSVVHYWKAIGRFPSFVRFCSTQSFSAPCWIHQIVSPVCSLASFANGFALWGTETDIVRTSPETCMYSLGTGKQVMWNAQMAMEGHNNSQSIAELHQKCTDGHGSSFAKFRNRDSVRDCFLLWIATGYWLESSIVLLIQIATRNHNIE